VKLAYTASCPEARRCAACLRRSLRVAVVVGCGLPGRTPSASVREQARCWTWHFLESDLHALARLRGISADVLVVPGSPPDACGLPPIRQLKAHLPNLRVLVLAKPSEKPAVLRLLQDGVSGCLMKPVSPEQFARAVAEVAQGQTLLCAEAQAALLEFAQSVASAPRPEILSPCEHEVMLRVAQGLDDKHISSALNRTEGTIHTHLASIYRKLGVHDRNTARRQFARLCVAEAA
jgi:DNA-binding NarL/FixJ family response regulator